MKKLIKLLFSRLFWLIISLAFQLAVLTYLIFASTNYHYVYYFLYALTALMAIFVVSRDENPAYKLAWLLLMCVFPFVGVVLYIIFGNKKITKRASRRLVRYRDVIDKAIVYDKESMEKVMSEDSRFSRQIEYIYETSRYGVWENTECKYFPDGDSFLDDLLCEISKAKHFIFIEYFIIGKGYMWTHVLSALIDKVNEGVEVRLLYDDLGSINVLPKNYYKELRSYGIDAHAFNPVRAHLNPRLNYRDHRKIFCIDGNVCYTGGLNLADEYMNKVIRFGLWKDNAIKIKGDAVWNLTLSFLLMFRSTTGKSEQFDKYRPTCHGVSDGFVQPFADSPFDGISVARNAYMQVINNARHYIWIVTPYLILDNEMVTALQIAAQSGVDVKIITPNYADKKSVHEVTRSYYETLSSAGVKIYEYIPGFIHSKTLVSDDQIAFVGTANMDYRSFYLHFELSVLFMNSSMVQEVKNDTLKALDHAKEQTQYEIESTSFPRRLLRSFFGIFAPAL